MTRPVLDGLGPCDLFRNPSTHDQSASCLVCPASFRSRADLTKHFLTSEPQNNPTNEFHAVQKRRFAEFEALELSNVRSATLTNATKGRGAEENRSQEEGGPRGNSKSHLSRELRGKITPPRSACSIDDKSLFCFLCDKVNKTRNSTIRR